MNWLSRTHMLFGGEAVERLRRCRVAVFGIGGVGGYAVEVLARSGVGEIHLIDNDVVSETNLNRQIVALRSTIGQYKVDVAARRIADINPACKVVAHKCFFLPDTTDIDLCQYDYVADCIDTITAKIALIRLCAHLRVPIIVCMGAANKFDPTGFRVGDLAHTQVDPLAKVIRKKLRAEGITHVKCVWSEEAPQKPSATAWGAAEESIAAGKHTIPASNAFVPATAGIIVGGEIVKDLAQFVPIKNNT